MPDERVLLETYIRERGLKMTESRRTVLEAFLAMEGHVTAEELFETARTMDPGIGQATVFRTIKLLADAGLAIEARACDDGRQYERVLSRSHHDHLVCVTCGAIVEFSDPAIERAQDKVYREHGFSSVGHRLELMGVCPSCSAAKGGKR